jgi:hypothetical protein
LSASPGQRNCPPLFLSRCASASMQKDLFGFHIPCRVFEVRLCRRPWSTSRPSSCRPSSRPHVLPFCSFPESQEEYFFILFLPWRFSSSSLSAPLPAELLSESLCFCPDAKGPYCVLHLVQSVGSTPSLASLVDFPSQQLSPFLTFLTFCRSDVLTTFCKPP